MFGYINIKEILINLCCLYNLDKAFGCLITKMSFNEYLIKLCIVIFRIVDFDISFYPSTNVNNIAISQEIYMHK